MSGAGRFQRAGAIDWKAVERSPEFQELVTTRRRTIAPLTIVFLVGSLTYLVLAAFVPSVMGWQIVDGLPFAWVAALSQVALTWAITWSYMRRADHSLEPLERRAAEAARHDGRPER
jgi:uncharacterized membrane protein (DUF485 family)